MELRARLLVATTVRRRPRARRRYAARAPALLGLQPLLQQRFTQSGLVRRLRGLRPIRPALRASLRLRRYPERAPASPAGDEPRAVLPPHRRDHPPDPHRDRGALRLRRLVRRPARASESCHRDAARAPLSRRPAIVPVRQPDRPGHLRVLAAPHAAALRAALRRGDLVRVAAP